MSNYTEEQISDAKRLAEALSNIPDGKRGTFALMVESMMIGAELAESHG